MVCPYTQHQQHRIVVTTSQQIQWWILENLQGHAEPKDTTVTSTTLWAASPASFLTPSACSLAPRSCTLPCMILTGIYCKNAALQSKELLGKVQKSTTQRQEELDYTRDNYIGGNDQLFVKPREDSRKCRLLVIDHSHLWQADTMWSYDAQINLPIVFISSHNLRMLLKRRRIPPSRWYLTVKMGL